jgi:hypothetical protein
VVPDGAGTVRGARAPRTRSHPRRAGAALPRDEDEDIIAVVDGRPSLADEAKLAPAQLRRFLRTTIARWLKDTRFLDAVPGHLPGDAVSQGRVPVVHERLRSIAGL